MANLAAWLLAESYLDCRDVGGRPLGEANAPSGYGPAGVDEEICRYPDRRALFEAPMNVSALRQVSAAWSEVTAAMAAARRAVCGERAPSLAEAWCAAMLLRVAALRDAWSGEPPSEARAAAYKASLGYAKVYWIAALVDDPRRPAQEVLPPARFFEFLEAGDWLVGGEQVCAGTRRMIEQGHAHLTGEGGGGGAVEAELVRFAGRCAAIEGLAALCVALVRERALSGRVSEVPDFGNPHGGQVGHWPGCVCLHQAARSVLVTALRGVPGAGPAAVVRALRAAGVGSDGLERLGDPAARAELDLYGIDDVLFREWAALEREPEWRVACAAVVRAVHPARS